MFEFLNDLDDLVMSNSDLELLDKIELATGGDISSTIKEEPATEFDDIELSKLTNAVIAKASSPISDEQQRKILDSIVNSNDNILSAKNYNKKYGFLLHKFLNQVNSKFKTEFKDTLEFSKFVWFYLSPYENLKQNFKIGYFNMCFFYQIEIDKKELEKLQISFD